MYGSVLTGTGTPPICCLDLVLKTVFVVFSLCYFDPVVYFSEGDFFFGSPLVLDLISLLGSMGEEDVIRFRTLTVSSKPPPAVV